MDGFFEIGDRKTTRRQAGHVLLRVGILRVRMAGAMRRLFRILLNGAMALSLLLCLATMGLWLLSHWQSVTLDHSVAGYHYSMIGSDGVIFLSVDRGLHRCTRGRERAGFWKIRLTNSTTEVEGPEEHSAPGDGRWLYREFEGPIWIPAAAFSMLPLAAGVLVVRRRRASIGMCVRCGYDLRATPDRCPECGGVVAHSRSSLGVL